MGLWDVNQLVISKKEETKMISFELSDKTALEIFLDKKGIEELIESLEFIKSSKDHIHLINDIDLSTQVMHEGNSLIHSVMIMYLDEGELSGSSEE